MLETVNRASRLIAHCSHTHVTATPRPHCLFQWPAALLHHHQPARPHPPPVPAERLSSAATVDMSAGQCDHLNFELSLLLLAFQRCAAPISDCSSASLPQAQSHGTAAWPARPFNYQPAALEYTSVSVLRAHLPPDGIATVTPKAKVFASTVRPTNASP